MLLVMGLGAQLTAWPDDLIELLARRFRVVTFDNRDAGLSTEIDGPAITPAAYMRSTFRLGTPRSAYLLADMADDAVGLLDALHIDRAHVVGVSMGGMIAQTMAISHHTRVVSLTSIMSNTGDRRRGRTAPRLMAKLARRPPASADTAVEEFVKTYALLAGPVWDRAEVEQNAKAAIARSYRPAGTARQLGAITASPNRTSDLANVSAPTLVIHGMLDRLVLPSGGMATAGAVPGARLLMFPDMAHDLPATRIPEIAEAIEANTVRAA